MIGCLKGFERLGKAERMSEERLSERVYGSDVEGGRGRGRHWFRCLDRFKEACDASSLELRDAQVMSIDGQYRWRMNV